MKKLSLVLILLVSTSFVSAKSTKSVKRSNNQSKFDVRVPVKKWIKKLNDGFRFGIAQGSLSSNLKSRNNASDNSINQSPNTKIQLHVGYENIRMKKIGQSVFLTYQDVDFNDELDDYRNMRISGNITYGVAKQLYTYGGLNWGKWYGSNEIEAALDAGIGYQAGVGFKLGKKINLEMEYLALLNDGRKNDINYDSEVKGMMIKVNTPFSFNL
ncbi:MAG: hypothetical protein HON90_12335 [Halobacteriovoraceae bacterium]|nr:hypothetical protein [Halobacteriovoraceae bacterium]